MSSEQPSEDTNVMPTILKARLVNTTIIDQIGQRAKSRIYVPMKVDEIQSAIVSEFVYVIYFLGDIVGFIAYRLRDDERVELREFVVDVSMRGKGVGTEALRLAIKQMPTRATIELVTHPENPARHLYGRQGFRDAAVIADYYGDGEPRVKMVRPPQI